MLLRAPAPETTYTSLAAGDPYRSDAASLLEVPAALVPEFLARGCTLLDAPAAPPEDPPPPPPTKQPQPLHEGSDTGGGFFVSP